MKKRILDMLRRCAYLFMILAMVMTTTPCQMLVYAEETMDSGDSDADDSADDDVDDDADDSTDDDADDDADDSTDDDADGDADDSSDDADDNSTQDSTEETTEDVSEEESVTETETCTEDYAIMMLSASDVLDNARLTLSVDYNKCGYSSDGDAYDITVEAEIEDVDPDDLDGLDIFIEFEIKNDNGYSDKKKLEYSDNGLYTLSVNESGHYFIEAVIKEGHKTYDASSVECDVEKKNLDGFEPANGKNYVLADKITQTVYTTHNNSDLKPNWNAHGAGISYYESDSEGNVKNQDKYLRVGNDSYKPLLAGDTYITVSYEETGLYYAAKYIVPITVEKKVLADSDITLEVNDNKNGKVAFTIIAKYAFGDNELAQKAKEDGSFSLTVKDCDGECTTFEKGQNVSKIEKKVSGTDLEVTYTFEKSILEDNWDSLFSKMYKKPFCLATECEITNIASGNKDFTGGYTLSTESVSIKVDNEWIIGKEREFTTDGYTIPITINPNNFWEWLGSMFNSIEYEYEIIEDTDNILESHEMDGNQLKVTVNKIGHAEIKVTASPWLFFDFGEQIILLNIISPAVSEDAIRFNGQDWRTFSNGLVDGWTDQNVEVTVEHPYYNQIQAFYTKGGETRQIGDGTSDSIVLNVQSMTDYTFRLTHSAYGTRYEVSAQLGIDTTKPTYDADSIKTVAPSAGIPKADTLYYKEEAQAEGKFRDAQSGLEKVIITGYSKEAWEDDWRAFSEELTPDGDGVVSYTLRYGVYKNLVFSAYDKVGNHVDDIKIGDTELIVVDDRKPSVAVDAKLIWSDGNFSDYDGSWTNKQIQMEVTVTNNLSGIASVQYAYVPNGTADSVNKNWVTMDAEAVSSVIFGSDDFADSAFDGPMDQPDTEGAQDAEAVIGIAPSDVKALTTAKNTRIVLDEEYFKNGIVYFKIKSKAGLVNDYDEDENSQEEIKLQQRNLNAGGMALYVDQEPAATGWYNAEFVGNEPYLSFAFPSGIEQDIVANEDPLPVNVYCQMDNTTNGASDKRILSTSIVEDANGNRKLVIGSQEGYSLLSEGVYTIYLWAADEAGNRSNTLRYEAKADYEPPKNVMIYVEGEDITRDASDGTVYFSHFYNSSVEISTSAEFGVSELGSYKICEARKSGDWNKNGTNWHSFNKDEGSFSLSPNARCFFYVVAEDQAGNETVVSSEGVVTDKEAPIGKDGTELTIRPIGENKNGFFNKDFDVEIAVQDSPTDDDCAALKEVTYLISNSEDKSNTEKIFSFNNSNPTSSQLSAAQEFEETVKIDAKDYESNTAYIEVTAVDNSENERITQQELKIDITAPEITVTYDNNDALHEKYYQRNRTAKIHIHELNFDASDVEFEITKDGVNTPGMTPSPASWESDGDDHYAYITFAEDGDYTLTLSYTDLADNEAVYDTVDEFTIDKTKPVVTVDYNNNTPWKDIYYNTARTATITVEEHNFDAKDFVLSAVPARTISGWTHNGDTHTTTIAFTEDGEYTYSFDFVDLAGNAMAPFTEEHFKIDTVEPVVEIRGIEDQSANAGDVMPVVVVQDENFDMGGVEISLRNGRGQEVSLVRNLSAIENGYQYTLPTVTEQEDSIYYLTASGTDLAGNTSEVTYRFSLNRHGSSYDLSSMSYLVDKVYARYVDIHDLEVLEMNIDTVEKFSIYVSCNGTMLDSEESNHAPSAEGTDKIYYSVKQEGNESYGYTYTYTIYKENFAKEGVYNIMFYSKDRAGNEVNNTLNDKDAEISFIVDNSAPKVVIDGIEENELYNEDSKKVNVMTTDNFKLKDAEIYLINELGEKVQTWDYLALAGEEGKEITIEIPSSDMRQSLLFYAVDEAGNEVQSLKDNEQTPKSFLITTNPWLRYKNSAVAKGITVAVVGVVALVGAGFYYRRRKKDLGSK